MARSELQDGNDWRGVLRGLESSLAQLPASAHVGQFLEARGFRRAAETAYRETLDRHPAQRDAMQGLARLLDLQGRRDEAAFWRRQAVEIELAHLGVPAEHVAEAAEFRLAADGHAPQPDRVPAAYVASLFDQYADDFDAHLTEVLAYRGPEVIAEVVRRLLPATAPPQDVVDLGCGTGLAGPLLRRLARRLDGVDLSPRMLDRARERGVYDRLDARELCDVLAERSGEYDLAVAADVLVYFGELEPVFASMHGALRPGGLFVASCENLDQPEYALRGTRRYAHHPDYVRERAQARGFAVECEQAAVLRREQSEPVSSTIYGFRRSGTN